MVEGKNIFRMTGENLTTGSVNAVVRLTMSSFHGEEDKLIKQFTYKNAPLKGAFFLY
ncbi:MAG: hypothetical protein WAN57_08600 [Smithella sp.]